MQIVQEFSNVDTYAATYISFIYHKVNFGSGIKESTHHCYINGAGPHISSIAVISWEEYREYWTFRLSRRTIMLLLRTTVGNEMKILGCEWKEGFRFILAIEPDLTLSTRPCQLPLWRNVSPWWMWSSKISISFHSVLSGTGDTMKKLLIVTVLLALLAVGKCILGVWIWKVKPIDGFCLD